MKCQRLSGDALDEALDAERDAIEAIKATRTNTPVDALKKTNALLAMLSVLGQIDERLG